MNIEVPMFYEQLVKFKINDRLLSNPNDSYSRKILYKLYRFPTDNKPNFVHLIKSLKKFLEDEIEECRHPITLLGKVTLDRNKKVIKKINFPKDSRIDSIIKKAIDDDQTLINMYQEDIFRADYTRTVECLELRSSTWKISITVAQKLLNTYVDIANIVYEPQYKKIVSKVTNETACTTHNKLIRWCVDLCSNYCTKVTDRVGSDHNFILFNNALHHIDDVMKDVLNDIVQSKEAYGRINVARIQSRLTNKTIAESVEYSPAGIKRLWSGIPDFVSIIGQSTSYINTKLKEIASITGKPMSRQMWYKLLYLSYIKNRMTPNAVEKIRLSDYGK